jgi:hypothetical protein
MFTAGCGSVKSSGSTLGIAATGREYEAGPFIACLQQVAAAQGQQGAGERVEDLADVIFPRQLY